MRPRNDCRRRPLVSAAGGGNRLLAADLYSQRSLYGRSARVFRYGSSRKKRLHSSRVRFLVSLEGCCGGQLAVVDPPHSYAAIGAAGGDPRPVRAERHRIHPAVVVQPGDLPPVAASNTRALPSCLPVTIQRPVRAEGHARHAARRGSMRAISRRGCVATPARLRRAAGDDPGPVRAERRRIHRPSWPSGDSGRGRLEHPARCRRCR